MRHVLLRQSLITPTPHTSYLPPQHRLPSTHQTPPSRASRRGAANMASTAQRSTSTTGSSRLLKRIGSMRMSRRGSTEQSLAQAEDFKMDEECLDKSIVHAQIQGIQTELRGYAEKERREEGKREPTLRRAM